MVTDRQVRKLRKLVSTGYTLERGAAKADMGETAAHKYISSGELPSEMSSPHTWRTREDPFAAIWEKVRQHLEVNPGLEGKSLFEYLQRQDPGRFSDGQVRTFQRRGKVWRALEGSPKEVFFAQVYSPGELSESDFTWMNGVLSATVREPSAPVGVGSTIGEIFAWRMVDGNAQRSQERIPG